MKIINNIRNYINDPYQEIIIRKNYIDITNYIKLGIIKDSEIEVIGEFNIIVKGNNLVIKKLLNNEILISGDIKNIEFRWLHEKYSNTKNNR